MRSMIALALFAVGFTANASVGETVDNPQPAAGPAAGAAGPIWRAPAAVLYTNGSLQSAATGGGASGTDPVSTLTAPDTSFGATCNNTAGANPNVFRLADDFVVPAGGWVINRVTVFGYQTQATPGGSTASTMTGGVLRIWNGPPNNAASTVVFGDVTTNRQTATSWSGVWRVQNTTLTNVLRPIMAVDMGNLNVSLPAGTYWLEYGLTGSTASGPFCPPNTTVSAANNALQFNATTSTWAPATDGGSLRPLDFPFVIDGVLPQPNITPTTPAGPVALGSFAPGGAVSRTFTFSNAAGAGSSGTVACTLTGAPAGLTLAPAGAQTIAPGASTTFTLSGTAPTTPGAFTGTITCDVQGGGTVTYTINGTVNAPAQAVNTLGPVGLLAILLGLFGIGLAAVRRQQ
jgi:hypothetical protein